MYTENLSDMVIVSRDTYSALVLILGVCLGLNIALGFICLTLATRRRELEIEIAELLRRQQDRS